MIHHSNNDILEQIKTVFEDGGTAAVKLFVDKELNEWKNTKINVAVLGTSGTGKSSFINAVLSLTADDEGSAPVGVTETTRTILNYPHPKYNNLVLWDLPGVGTPNYNRENYIEKVQLNRFDFFIFMTADRFREDDIWLAKELTAKKKMFYFARNKIGQDIRNNKFDHPKSHTNAGVMTDIRRNCEQNLKTLDTDRIIKVYLIDTHEPDNYEFGDLMDQLIKDAPENKKEAMVLSMSHMTDFLIEEKRERMSERIHYMSLLSGIVGAVPVPMLDFAVDAGVLVEEAIFYRDQFGLTDEMLDAYASRSNLSVEQLTKHLDLNSRIIQLSAKGLTSYFVKKGAKKAATLTSGRIMKYILPIFGNAASGASSYAMTSWCLHDLLDVMVEDAKKINEHKMRN